MNVSTVVSLGPTGFYRACIVRKAVMDRCNGLRLSNAQRAACVAVAIRTLTRGASAHAAMHAANSLAGRLAHPNRAGGAA
jgi:hypothetical protein